MKLTKQRIEQLAYEGDGKSADIRWDPETKGFGLRIYPSGTKSFVLRYSAAGIRKRTITLGQFPTLTPLLARQQAQKLKAQVIEGRDPHEARRRLRDGQSVRQVADRYMREHAWPKKRRRSAEEDDRNLRLHILPGLGHLNVASYTRKLVTA